MITAQQARALKAFKPIDVEKELQKLLLDIEGKTYAGSEFYEFPYNPPALKELAKKMNDLGFVTFVDLGKYKHGELQMNFIVDWSRQRANE